MILEVQVTIFVLQLLLLTAVIWFLVRCLSRLWSGKFDAPFVPTSQRYHRTIASALDINSSDTVYELGSGDGRFLLFCARFCPEAKYIGIERNLVLHTLAATRKLLAGNPANVVLIRDNFFRADVSKATKIYAYLLPSVMRELYPGVSTRFHGRFASRAFAFPIEAKKTVRLSERPGMHGEHLLHVYDF